MKPNMISSDTVDCEGLPGGQLLLVSAAGKPRPRAEQS